MFDIKIADVKIGIENQYEYVQTLCRDYIVNDSQPCAFSVRCTAEALKKEIDGYDFAVSAQIAESVCLYRSICIRLLDYHAFVLHAAVVVADGDAFAFLAPSGVGKTTHAKLWVSHFGADRAFILNGDKPLIRCTGGIFRAYGTPWCGKEGYNRNTVAPLKAMCFLEQGENNVLRETASDELIDKLTEQLLLPKDAEKVNLLFDELDGLLRQVTVKTLICNRDEDAAVIAYQGLHNQ